MDDETERWNREWLRYLEREWPNQLRPYTEYTRVTALPNSPDELYRVRLGPGGPLALYCHREDIEQRRVLELGCGCGNVGKQIARFASSYVGVDVSTLALAVARLTSPANCAYIHLDDTQAARAFHHSIDTVIARHFWIHQNWEMATRNLDFIEPFLVAGSRVYLDFFWPRPGEKKHFKVLHPCDAQHPKYPSAKFQWTSVDIQRLFEERPYRIAASVESPERPRRYVIAEYCGSG